MSVILILSTAIRLAATGWSLVLLRRLRDWRMGFFTVMLAFMALRQMLTLIATHTSWTLSMGGLSTEWPAFIVSVMAFLAIFFLERILTDRSRAEAEIKLLAEALRSTGDAVCITDLNDHILFVNKAFETIYGYQADEVIGQPVSILRSPEHPPAEDPTSIAPDKRQTWQGTLWNRRKDGTPFPITLSTAVVRGDYGEPIALIGVAADITEHKRVENALRASEEKFAKAFRNSPDAITLTTVGKERLVDVNESACRITGYTRDELIGRTTLDLDFWVHATERQRYVEGLRHKGRVVNLEADFRMKSGEIRTGLIAGEILALHDGDFILGTIRDITERKRVEKALQQRNRELSTLLEVSYRLTERPDLEPLLQTVVQTVIDTVPRAEAASLWLYDAGRGDLVIRAWAGHNDEAVAGLRVSPETSLVGLVFRSRQTQHIGDTASEPTFEMLGRAKIDQVRSVLGAPLLVEGQAIGTLFADNFSHKDAFDDEDARWLQALANQAAAAIQRVQLFEQRQREMAERLHALETLREREEQYRTLFEEASVARQRLEHVSRRLVEVQEQERRYIAMELHDQIGQTLTALKLLLEITDLRAPDAAQNKIEHAQELADELADKIRDLSLDLRPTMLDDFGLLPTLTWHVKRYAAQTRIHVDFQPSGLSQKRFAPEIETAAYRIVQEALTNVARHADVETVTVRTWTEDDTLHLLVADQGKGFDEATLAQIHTTGGLSGIRERAALLGGDVTISSDIGQGTCVTAVLPLPKVEASLSLSA